MEPKQKILIVDDSEINRAMLKEILGEGYEYLEAENGLRAIEILRRRTDIALVLLDLIIDYLTYVFIPAYALFASHLLPGWTGWFAIIVITFGSAMYFADTRMKTKDNSFSGFPGCWNMLVLVIFALEPSHWTSLVLVTLLAIAMFLPLKFVHPMRTVRWRPVTASMAVAWTIFAGWAAWVDFHPESWAHWGLIVTSIYLLLAGVAQQLIPAQKPASPT